MEEGAEILIPFELQFSDLLILSDSSSFSSYLSPEESSRFESLSNSIMQTLGPNGPGLLAIAGVPKAEELRTALLPLTRKIALLDNRERARILKEHGLGSDVPLKDPDRAVSSFALQLKHGQLKSSELFSSHLNEKEGRGEAEEKPTLQELPDDEFKHLGNTFKELGHCMMEVGLQLARACDKAIGGRELEQSIIDSCSAKGRLIHYHSVVDNLILKDSNRRSKCTRKRGAVLHSSLVCSSPKTSGNATILESGRVNGNGQLKLEDYSTDNSSTEVRCSSSLPDLWQQWHYDYGIFTILTAPLFLSSIAAADDSCGSSSQPCSSPDGHTYLQLFDATEKKIFVVRSSPKSFIVQVGEAADILSGGWLRSTLHSVARPVEIENLSRETFVVFLQPAWTKTLPYSSHLQSDGISEGELTSKNEIFSKSQQLMQDILRKIPPLASRLRDGMTFAEFSRETTKQYYGGSGTQSRSDSVC